MQMITKKLKAEHHETLCRIQANKEWFTIIVRNGTDNLTDNELRFMANWDMLRIKQFCTNRKWPLAILGEVDTRAARDEMHNPSLAFMNMG